MKRDITILIVDDDEDDKQLFIESAKEVDNNIKCVTASDGQEALRLLKDELNPLLPDYIFLDLRMPRISGKQCLEEIRKDNRLHQIPVFIYSTSRDVEDSIELKKKGAVHFISKPANPEDVYYILSTVFYEKWDQLEKI
jgi:CheY-like chemotaxis protein